MRLLQLQDGVLSLTKNLVDDIPPYAILSHTWGYDEQEVTLQDVIQGKGKDKEGFRKIEFCGKQATSDGLHYFWVDTCCIDKSSSAELQESLNSMFRWYQNAAKCYVYLADVPKKVKVDGLRRADWKLDLRASRWFRRGWTLQELLAPSTVEFFSYDGQYMGDKASLESLLNEITKIPTIALRNNQLSTFRVEERMLWIEHRQTKKAEDLAYSLFGIFDVQIPLLYGEGREKAFGRLRREIDNHDYQTRVVSKLPIAYGAAFDSHAEEHNPTCLKGTRVELLSQISKWANDPQTESLFWLNGMAGTGKSTISRTLATSYDRDGRLAASFFFKKGEADRGGVSKFFTTIAAQLARYIPATAQYIHSTINTDPAIFEKALPAQFEKLILQPLITSKGAIPQAPSCLHVIIVDALDECENEDDMTLLIKLFSDVKGKIPGLKVFITSRPELPIRLGFKATKGAYDKVVLHEITDSVIENDISVFLAHELEQIRYNYNESVEEQERKLPTTWPTQQDSRDLVKMAVPLFISAATVCLFIADRVGGNPRKKLEKILKNRTRAQGSKLDAMYLIVLEQLLAGLSGEDLQEVLAQFRKVVGSTVVLASPLSSSALARLLDLPMEDVSDLLDLLHSVLSVPSSSKQPIRLLYLSFRDFLLDPKQSEENPFWIDQKKTHKQLATDCFRILKKTLRNDICGVHHPGTEHSSIDSEKISTMLPDEVQYACEYWAYHLRESGVEISDGGEVHTFLSEHFLQWLEASSLIRRLSESVNTIRILRNLVPASSQIARFSDDALRFILAFIPIIHQAPLQVYSSALVFAPQNSIIRLSFENQIPGSISLQPQVPPNWSSNMQTLEAHTGSVRLVVFSSNSKLVASYSWDDPIKLWAADSGALLQTLEVHKQVTKSLAFSPDGRTFSSVSSDGIIRLWDVGTGAPFQTRDIQVRVNSAAFSTNMKLLVTVTGGKPIQIWVTGTGALHQTLEGSGYKVISVAFSSDAKLVAAGSGNRKVSVWNTDTGTLLRVITNFTGVYPSFTSVYPSFTGVYGNICSLSFSPNSKLVASASKYPEEGATVRIWDVSTGVLLHTHDYDYDLRSAAFSPDLKLVALASWDGTIQLRATDTGAMQQLLESHWEHVLSVAFSPDGKLVASGSIDKTLRLWYVNIDTPAETRFDGPINSLSLSPDKRIVASVSDDHTVRLWDTYSGMLQRTLEGHSETVLDVTFSPDGKIVASRSKDGTARLWAVDTGTLRHTFHDDGTSTPIIRRITFSPDSKLVALVSRSDIVLWDTDTGGLLCRDPGNSLTYIDSVVFSPDSKHLASVSETSTTLYYIEPWRNLFKFCSLKFRQSFEGCKSIYMCPSAVFSPDGRLLALPSDRKTVHLWATGSGKLQHILDDHREKIIDHVAFSPDSKWVASASDDKTVRLWKTDTGMLYRVVDIGFRLKSLAFLTTNKLQTDAGIITVDKPSVESGQGLTPIPGSCRDNFSGFGLSSDGSWITLDGRNFIMLPLDYRPYSFRLQVLFGSTVVIGCNSGRPIFMRFSADEFQRSSVID